jgi:A/G-specific adenine glycosylase
MLQQTQVAAALPYFERFVARFPDVSALAAGSRDDVLALWSGLGYYRRAHHLHEAARAIVAQFGGAFPRDAAALASLPGIGRSTAAAIATFAFGARAAILDGNVKRVLARHRGVEGFPGAPAVERVLWAHAEALLPDDDVEAYTQGLMDLGATICVRSSPRCLLCPVAQDCVARREGRVDALPAPRPSRVIPHREVQLLVLERDGEVLLVRRPSTGVWAGLWSLPEVAADADVHAAATARCDESLAPVPLPALTHAFTHFTLAMRPWRVRVLRAQAGENSDELWLPKERALTLGLPAPIRTLLQALSREPSTS